MERDHSEQDQKEGVNSGQLHIALDCKVWASERVFYCQDQRKSF